MTQQLIEDVFLPAFDNPFLLARHDGAVLDLPRRPSRGAAPRLHDRLLRGPARSFFPGGDIGTLAVNGTVNDLAMCGARPLYLSAGFILEEGFPIETCAASSPRWRGRRAPAGVALVTGDTKVVDRGKGDGIFINTAGIGVVEHVAADRAASVRPGDAVILLSGDIGRHGIAILAAREGLGFEIDDRERLRPARGARLDADPRRASRSTACAT